MRQFDEIIQRLRQHFGTVAVHPSVAKTARRELCQRVPSVPDVLLSFWHYCDGIQVTRFEEGTIFGIQQSLSFYPLYCEPDLLGRFVPLRGDGCGNHDCLIVGQGSCEGAVVFWDHEVYDGAAYLLGGSLLGYLDMWADHMIHEFLPNGERDPRCKAPELDAWPWYGTPEYQHPWPFDESWMRERDPIACRILHDEKSRRWLLEQDDLT